MKFTNKTKKIVILIIIIALVIPTIAITGRRETPKEVSYEDGNERVLAAQISNMTGVGVEEILDLRKSGLTWNEVLKSLNNKTGDSMEIADLNVNQTDFEKQLIDDGYSEEEINDANMLIDRLIYSLDELMYYVEDQMPTSDLQEPMIHEDIDDENKKIEKCKEIYEQLDHQFLLYTTVKLKNYYGTMEAVIDEYLYSLQIDIDFQQAIEDHTAYEKDKQENSLGLSPLEVITMKEIETLLLSVIQRANVKVNNSTLDEKGDLYYSNDSTIVDLPNNPTNEINTVEVTNPTKDLLQEIEELNPNY